MKDFSFWIEDGQFSREMCSHPGLVSEGKIILDDDGNEVYVLFVDYEGKHVLCVGGLVVDFPKNWDEHQKLKTSFQSFVLPPEETDYEIIFHKIGSPSEVQKVVMYAVDKESVMEVFYAEYKGFEIVEVVETDMVG